MYTYLYLMLSRSISLPISALLISLCIVACNGGHPNEESKKDHLEGSGGPVAKRQDSLTAKATVGALIAHYLHVKDGLVNNDSRFAAQGAQALVADLKHLNTSRYPDQEAQAIEKVREQITDMATHIHENAKGIEHQREHFKSLSRNIYVLAISFGYVQPLYVYRLAYKDDEREVLWLSEVKSDKSPYTGISEPNIESEVEQINL